MLGGACALVGCNADRAADPPSVTSASVQYEDYEAPPPMPSAGPISPRAQRIFSDFHGRWPDSKVWYIGKIDGGPDYFEIYQFDFVNPQTEHGTQLIAFLRNGKYFAGRYAINGHASGTEAVVTGLEGSTIIFTCDEPPPQRVERVTIQNRALPSKFRLCGKSAIFEKDGI